MTVPHVIHQAYRFGIVGGVATATHVAVFVTLIQTLQAQPILANFLAWVTAFSVSFVGHYYWTFRATKRRSANSTLPRFVLVSLFGLALNTFVVMVVVDLAHEPYGWAAVLMATVVPTAVFVVSKYWAFA